MKGDTVLVTGGAGFIGSHVAKELLKLGARVIIIDDLSGGFESNLPSEALFEKGSICDQYFVDNVIEYHRPKYVYHLAAYAAEGLSFFIPSFNYKNNLIGTVNLVNASIKFNVKHFVFTSSIAVYGHPEDLPVTEEMTPHPVDPYGIAKYAAELHLQTALDQFGMNHTIFRPHNVYGPFQNIGDRYRNVIGIFMNQVMNMEPMTIFGDGSQTRAFSYIDDVAPLIARAPLTIGAFNETFNIGSDSHYLIRDLADIVAAEFGVEPNTNFQPSRNEVSHIWASHEKIEKVFGTQKETPLVEGISLMGDWVRKHGARTTQKFKDIEIVRGLPLHWR